MTFQSYSTGTGYDEYFECTGTPRIGITGLVQAISNLGEHELRRRQQVAERALLHTGITFQVYSDRAGLERIFPLDLIPRVVLPGEWQWIEKGLKQRIFALNLFLQDLYGDRKILRDNVIPPHVIESAKCFRAACAGIQPRHGIWCHITGTDLVRHSDGQLYVLEDNMRCPSGVSYVLENRRIMKRSFPRIFERFPVSPVDDYPSRLLDLLHHMAPPDVQEPTTVVLSPGIYNSAYFEHSFLAQQMGVELVEGRDLVVMNGLVHMRTTRGLKRVDVIYRRIDDDFLDPQAFRPDSMIGVPGLMEAFKNGRVSLVNAPGTGVADDKVVYAYVPKIIKYYLGEDAIIPNVPTFLCWDERDRAYVLANLDKLVVKAANEAGGYGMMIGPHATKADHAHFAELIQASPRNYIAQPTLSLSTVPTTIDGVFEPRHVDLRPYILYGRDIHVHPGGLTRVALRRGSLVVNSSQGGGSKDTWILSEDPPEVLPVPTEPAAEALR
ncbi:MAG: circularly permuted type 2 ATP-grasp protein [Bryobacterales bacterium]|nr:circularly permuted type 2 ATP-grasp protein [Bryobacterales bacterium]